MRVCGIAPVAAAASVYEATMDSALDVLVSECMDFVDVYVLQGYSGGGEPEGWYRRMPASQGGRLNRL